MISEELHKMDPKRTNELWKSMNAEDRLLLWTLANRIYQQFEEIAKESEDREGYFVNAFMQGFLVGRSSK